MLLLIQFLFLEFCDFFECRCIFRLPTEITKIAEDKKKLLAQMNITIRNIHGIRCGLNSPQMAFETFTSKQIERLKDPIKICIDLVMEELCVAVGNCTEEVSKFVIYVKNTNISIYGLREFRKNLKFC